MSNTRLLRALVDAFLRYQQDRIRLSNVLDAVCRGEDVITDSERCELQDLLNHVTAVEERFQRYACRLVRLHPMRDEIVKVRGISDLTAAKLLAMLDIHRADTVSKLWRFCGYAVIDGKAERPRKGERRHYSTRLKAHLYNVAVQFLRGHSRYALVYYAARRRYAMERPEWSARRSHFAAFRKMVKVFLSHLWERWRRLEGLPTRGLYVHDYLGHTTRYDADWFWSREELRMSDFPPELREYYVAMREAGSEEGGEE